MSSVDVVLLPQQIALSQPDVNSKPQPLSLQTNSTSFPTSNSNTGHSSSPEARPVDPRSPILEEEEEETSSEAANEPVTPTDTQHGHEFHHTSHDGINHDGAPPSFPATAKLPLVVSTPATPPPPASGGSTTPIVATTLQSQTNTQTKPASARESGIRRGISQIFRRSSSHQTDNTFFASNGASDTALSNQSRQTSIRRRSAATSPFTTRSNSPPSPGSPTDTSSTQRQTSMLDPHPDQFLSSNGHPRKNRSSTGLSIRQKFITFGGATNKKPKYDSPPFRERASSAEFRSGSINVVQPQAELTHHMWALAPEEGTGLKARRLSLSLPDDFHVDIGELDKEFVDARKVIGKKLGKGATSTVKLMHRKGTDKKALELYAVKEFRGKNSAEKEEEYTTKVKSEFCIAKSLHHPNIVETVRLCRHNGKWNHVMEFCESGDLFNFVQNGFLKSPDRLSDRLCLFKQLVQGVQYLHEHGIAHRDIKLENLLINQQSKLKITDFGVSEVFTGIHPGLRAAGGECGKQMGDVRLCQPGICGSMPYIAPEVVERHGEYDPRPLDVWSSAVVMLNLIFGGSLWQKADESLHEDRYDQLLRGWRKWDATHNEGDKMTETDYPNVNAFDAMVNPPALRRVLLGMLHPDPKKRMTISEVAKNRWVKNIECCQVDSYDDPKNFIDAAKGKSAFGGTRQKVVHHDHLIPKHHRGHGLVRLPGSTDM